MISYEGDTITEVVILAQNKGKALAPRFSDDHNVADNTRTHFPTQLSNQSVTDSDPQLRRMAAIELSRKTHRNALAGLSNLVDDEDDSVRLQTAVALGKIHGNEANELLAQMLLDDPNPSVRR